VTAGGDSEKIFTKLREARERAEEERAKLAPEEREELERQEREELERQAHEVWERVRPAERDALARDRVELLPAPEPLVAERLESIRVEVVSPAEEPKRRGRKSRWKRAQLETIMRRLANGDGPTAIEGEVGIRHQRISELDRRKDVYWDRKERRLVTPRGTVSEGGYVILPPVPR
jgi:hypothetical protein